MDNTNQSDAIDRTSLKWRIPLQHEKFPFVLFWSEKSGCTSLIKWFFHHIGVLDEALDHSPWVHEYEANIFKKGDYIDRLEKALSGGKPAVKLVRNPFRRVVSGFLSVAKAPARHEPAWVLGEWERIMKSPQIRIRPTEGVTFSQFLQYLAPKATREAVNAHFARQFVPGERRYCNNYIRLENLSDELRKLEQDGDLHPAPLDRLMESPHHSVTDPRLNWDPEKTIRPGLLTAAAVPSYKSFYSAHEVNMVRDIFAIDFEIYGYDRSFPQ